MLILKSFYSVSVDNYSLLGHFTTENGSPLPPSPSQNGRLYWHFVSPSQRNSWILSRKNLVLSWKWPSCTHVSTHNFANHRFLFATRDTADQTFRAADDVRNAKIELFAVIAVSLIFTRIIWIGLKSSKLETNIWNCKLQSNDHFGPKFPKLQAIIVIMVCRSLKLSSTFSKPASN